MRLVASENAARIDSHSVAVICTSFASGSGGALSLLKMRFGKRIWGGFSEGVARAGSTVPGKRENSRRGEGGREGKGSDSTATKCVACAGSGLRDGLLADCSETL